jgi:hypothetical protein
MRETSGVDAHRLQQQYIFKSQDEVRQKCWTDFMSAVMAEVLTILDVHNHHGNLGIACRAGLHSVDVLFGARPFLETFGQFCQFFWPEILNRSVVPIRKIQIILLRQRGTDCE